MSCPEWQTLRMSRKRLFQSVLLRDLLSQKFPRNGEPYLAVTLPKITKQFLGMRTRNSLDRSLNRLCRMAAVLLKTLFSGLKYSHVRSMSIDTRLGVIAPYANITAAVPFARTVILSRRHAPRTTIPQRVIAA